MSRFLESLARQFALLVASIEENLAVLKSFGEEDVLPSRITDSVGGLERVATYVAADPVRMSVGRLGDAVVEARQILKAMPGIREAALKMMRKRVEELHPSVRELRRKTIEDLISAWELVKSINDAEGAKSYRAMVDEVIKLAEDESARERTRDILRPARTKAPERRRHSRSEYDKSLRQSMKGVNQPAQKHGHRKQKTA